MANGSPLNTMELRRANRNRVLRQLYFHEPEGIQKQDLAVKLGMSLPTLTQNLSELSELGLIDSSRTAESSGGRRPHMLAVRGDARFAVGVELASRHLRMVALDLLGHELAYRTITRSFEVSEAYYASFAADLESFIDESGIDRTRLLGVGVTLPGIVDEEHMTLSDAPTLNIARQDFTVFAESVPYPVRLVNDANAGGYAECWGRTGQTMAYLSLGRGVGGAIMFSGEAYHGQHGRSGEFGHTCIHPGGRTCACGRTGCLEAYCSTAILSEDLDISLEEFFFGLERGNQRYERLWNEYLDDLAIGVRNIHTALDCEIVLGGKLSMFLESHLAELDRRLRETDPCYMMEPYIAVSRYHDRANSVGAALRFFDRFIREV